MSIKILLILVSTLTLVTVALIVITAVRAYRRKADRAGYASIGAYLRAVPRSDGEKRDAVDMTVKGGVLCLVGLVFPPLLIVGVLPLFYGTRKLLNSSMGLGLVDDAEQPGA